MVVPMVAIAMVDECVHLRDTAKRVPINDLLPHPYDTAPAVAVHHLRDFLSAEESMRANAVENFFLKRDTVPATRMMAAIAIFDE